MWKADKMKFEIQFNVQGAMNTRISSQLRVKHKLKGDLDKRKEMLLNEISEKTRKIDIIDLKVQAQNKNKEFMIDLQMTT